MAGLAAGLAASPISAQPLQAPAVSQASIPANVNLNPKRITFNRTGRSAMVSVSSSGGAGSFDVELVDRVMLPNGQIVAATNPLGVEQAKRLKSASPFMVVTPRRIRVAQGSSQAIRLRASATTNLEPGEYRSHLTVTGIPPADAGLTAEQAAGQNEGELSFRLNSVLAISIPVILRVGPIDVRAGIEKASIGYENISPDGRAAPVRTAVISLDLVRLGSNSLFGNVEVRGGRKQGDAPLGAVRGIGVYPEIERRAVKIPLAELPASGDQLEIRFLDDDTAPGAILSKVALVAP